MNIVKVPFHGHELTAIQTVDAVMVPLKPICDRLGLDRKSQQAKINSRKELYTGAMIALDAADRKSREMLCLPITRLAMWLASINPLKVKPELKGTLVLYQREAADVLDRYFRKGETVAPRVQRIDPDPEPPMPKLRAPKNPLAANGWQGFELADYVEYLQLKAWALEVENRRLRRKEVGHA